MSDHEYSVAVLLPTRGRTTALHRSIISLFNRTVKDEKEVEIIIGFDNDDTESYAFFEKEIEPWLDNKNVNYTVMKFDRLGYGKLEQYINALAKQSDADWLFVWNDDAIMETTGWNKKITAYNGQFKLLSVRTHRDHPNSIFPIIPRAWYDIKGYYSPHQLIDTWLSQIAYFLNIFERTDVYVTHDRYDLTGNNKDNTFADPDRRSREGNPADPADFNHPSWNAKRMADLEDVAAYLRANGGDLTFWDNVKAGKQDPFEVMRKNDPNKMMNIHGPR